MKSLEDLLTAQQVQDILQVNRITIYRMLQDGRLMGVKIGGRWRFPANQFEKLISGTSLRSSSGQINAISGLPVHCVQAIQDMYADLGMIGSIIVDTEGNPITKISNPCEVCVMMNASETGQKACESSWKECVASTKKSIWFTCHAGLQYMKIPIRENEITIAYLLTGQLYSKEPDSNVQREKMKVLAKRYSIDEQSLMQAAGFIPVYDAERRKLMESWPQKFTRAIEAMMKERSNLVDRLQKIVEISTL